MDKCENYEPEKWIPTPSIDKLLNKRFRLKVLLPSSGKFSNECYTTCEFENSIFEKLPEEGSKAFSRKI
jgi:hypothetical protein